MVVKNGVPSVLATSLAALGVAIIETTPSNIAMTNIVTNILDQFEDPAMIVIDLGDGKVHASTVAARKIELNDAVDVLIAESTSLSPDAGQTGRSLAFTAAGAIPGFDTADMTTAVKPKFSLASAISRLADKVKAYEAENPLTAGKHFIVIDQANKTVKVCLVEDGAEVRASLTAVDVTAAQGVRVLLTPEAEDVVADALPFEGGAV